MESRQPARSRPAKPHDLLKSLKNTQKKPTILEQASKDWDRCKQTEQIEDELKQATKSKSSFIERQQFLQRADQRQFEKEREIREKTRSKLTTPGSTS